MVPKITGLRVCNTPGEFYPHLPLVSSTLISGWIRPAGVHPPLAVAAFAIETPAFEPRGHTVNADAMGDMLESIAKPSVAILAESVGHSQEARVAAGNL